MQGFFQQFLLLYRPLTNKLNELLAEYGLSYSLWQVIFYVKNMGPSQLSSISAYFYIERPSVTRVVQQLEEKGLVEHVPGEDKRQKSIQLTERGVAIYHTCREKISELEHRILQDIPDEELQTVFDLFPHIRQNLIQQEEERT